MESATNTATGGDAAGEMQRLEGALEALRRAFAEAKGVAKLAEEAAAKCQVRRSVGGEAGVGVDGRRFMCLQAGGREAAAVMFI